MYTQIHVKEDTSHTVALASLIYAALMQQQVVNKYWKEFSLERNRKFTLSCFSCMLPEDMCALRRNSASHWPQRRTISNKSNQQQHDNKMAATVKTSNAVLLRRPLPPLPKKETQNNVRKKAVKDKGKDGGTIQVLNSLKRHTTPQKSKDTLKENEKMKVRSRAMKYLYCDFI